MPLPESLEALSAMVPGRQFRQTVRSLGEEVASGRPLASAMGDFPQYFPAGYQRMIAAAEASGTLPEVMTEIGQAAYLDRQIAGLFRQILLYPAIVFLFAFFLFLGMAKLVLKPICDEVLVLLGDGGGNFCFDLIGATAGHAEVLALLGLAGAGYCWFLHTDNVAATRQLLAVLRMLPGFKLMFRELLAARLCLFWGLMLRQQTPEPELFPLLAALVGDRAMTAALAELAARVGSGVPLGEALPEDDAMFEPPIALTLRNAPEGRLPDELTALGRRFLQDGAERAIRMTAAFEVVLTVAIAVFGGLVIIGLFAPLLYAVQRA